MTPIILEIRFILVPIEYIILLYPQSAQLPRPCLATSLLLRVGHEKISL